MAKTWKGIVGSGFKPGGFDAYAHQLNFGAWRPQFVVLHNTQIPTLAKWHDVDGHSRMRIFAEYYRDTMQWSAGPHLFVADDLIWVFTPLITPGVHSPSWNRMSWGVEVVGDFDRELFQGAIRSNAIAAVATLHAIVGLDPATIRLHREDPLTTHHCPGPGLDKTDFISRVQRKVASAYPGDHDAERGDIV